MSNETVFGALVLAICCAGGLTGGENVRIYQDPAGTQVLVESAGSKVVFDRLDSARIAGWRENGREYVAAPESGRGLARDALWSPRRMSRLPRPYVLTGTSVGADTVTVTFRGEVDALPFSIGSVRDEGLAIEKTYRILRSGGVIEVEHAISNRGKKPRTFSFWFHNWLDFGADYVLVLPGPSGVFRYPLGGPSGKENSMFAVPNAPYTSNNESLEEAYRLGTVTGGRFVLNGGTTGGCLILTTDYEKLLQVYTNIGTTGSPTLEFMCRPCVLNAGDIWRLKTTIQFTKESL